MMLSRRQRRLINNMKTHWNEISFVIIKRKLLENIRRCQIRWQWFLPRHEEFPFPFSSLYLSSLFMCHFLSDNQLHRMRYFQREKKMSIWSTLSIAAVFKHFYESQNWLSRTKSALKWKEKRNFRWNRDKVVDKHKIFPWHSIVCISIGMCSSQWQTTLTQFHWKMRKLKFIRRNSFTIYFELG